MTLDHSVVNVHHQLEADMEVGTLPYTHTEIIT